MEKITQYLTPLLLIIFVFVVAIITAPKKNTWKYEIKGWITIENEIRPAIWYTDTISSISDDSVVYHNSDGSRVVIDSPFILIDHSVDY